MTNGQDGCTGLILAALGGHIEVVVMMIEHGADAYRTANVRGKDVYLPFISSSSLSYFFLSSSSSFLSSSLSSTLAV
jgi:hypothetical protein